jgi:Ser/Thr protein kinase RdoA (MazF antagonist)
MNGAIAALLDHYAAGVRPLGPVEPLGNAGGLSGAKLFRFRSGRGQLVARRWPDAGRSLADLAIIHGQLRKAGDLGFVPVPLLALDGRTAIEFAGHVWEIAPWLAGTADLDRPPSPIHLRLMFGGLAAFLNRVGDVQAIGPSPGLARRLADLGRLRLGDFGRIRERIAAHLTDPASSLARRWLDRAAVLASPVFEATGMAARLNLPVQPCLRDARPDHFLFEGDRLSGLVDFGAMGVDTVAGDLARLLGEAVGPDRPARRAAFAAFEAIRRLAPEELQAIEAFERANALLAPSVWIDRHFFERRAFDDPTTTVVGLARCLDRLDEAF